MSLGVSPVMVGRVDAMSPAMMPTVVAAEDKEAHMSRVLASLLAGVIGQGSGEVGGFECVEFFVHPAGVRVFDLAQDVQGLFPRLAGGVRVEAVLHCPYS